MADVDLRIYKWFRILIKPVNCAFVANIHPWHCVSIAASFCHINFNLEMGLIKIYVKSKYILLIFGGCGYELEIK